MCYHIQIKSSKKKIEKVFEKPFEDSELLFKPSDHLKGFDRPFTPVIANNDFNEIQLFQWGFQIPSWKTLLNARVEKLEQTKSYRDFIDNRCLIIVDGFLEWKHLSKIGNKTEKHLLNFGGDLFTLAGIYRQIENKFEYSILTTEAKGIMYEIHNRKPLDRRMPIAFQTSEHWEDYLHNGKIINDYNFKDLNTNPQQSLF